jgi:hypothetical protein
MLLYPASSTSCAIKPYAFLPDSLRMYSFGINIDASLYIIFYILSFLFLSDVA